MLERAPATSLTRPVRRRIKSVLKRAGKRGYLDIETRSHTDLRVIGSYLYATRPTAEALCASWTVDDDPMQLWVPGDPLPTEQFRAATIVVHNANFDFLIWKYVLHRDHNWPLPQIEWLDDLLAQALAAGLPADLGKLAEALQLERMLPGTG